MCPGYSVRVVQDRSDSRDLTDSSIIININIYLHVDLYATNTAGVNDVSPVSCPLPPTHTHTHTLHYFSGD